MNKRVHYDFYHLYLPGDEDEGCTGVVPKLPGCCAFGDAEEEALQEAKVAVNLWLDTAQKDGREIPETGGRECLWDILAGKDRENILIPVLPRVRSPPDCEIPIIQN